MFKFFKKEKEQKNKYKIIFCNENNPATKFGEYGTYETYEKADHIIRMGWNKKRTDKINNGYKIIDGWILIEKTT